MRVGVVFGPGSHQKMHIRQLLQAGHTVLYARYFPTFEVVEEVPGPNGVSVEKRVIASSSTFDLMMHTMHALRHRTNYSLIDSSRIHYQFFTERAVPFLRKCDIIIAYSMTALEVLRSTQLKHIPQILEVPLGDVRTVISIRQAEVERFQLRGTKGLETVKQFTPRLIERTVTEYHQAAVLNCMSEWGHETFRRQNDMPKGDIRVTDLGVTISPEAGMKPRRDDKHFHLLFAGRVELIKGAHYLFQAFRSLQHNSNMHLWVAGSVSDEMRPFLKEIEGPQLHLLGLLPQAQLFERFRSSDVFVFPTLCEGMALVNLEAMSFALPVVSTYQSGGSSFLRSGENGQMIESHSVDAIVHAVQTLADNSDRSFEMGQQAHHTILNGFTDRHYGQRLDQLVRSVASTRAHEAA